MCHILIIDDDDMILGVYKQLLERSGHKLTITKTAESGISIFEETPDKFELVIVDKNLEGVDGFQVRKAIQSIRTVPVRICTGDLEDGEFILHKPFTLTELTTMVENALEGRSE